jgi:hypothetical protein
VVEEVVTAAESKKNKWTDAKSVDNPDLQITENPSEQIKKGFSTKKVVDMDI